MKLHTLTYQEGSRKKATRRGQGIGSGLGKTSGAGQKDKSRVVGVAFALVLKGGQNPIYRRVSKEVLPMLLKLYAIVNVEKLNAFEDGATVCPTCMKERG